MAAYGSGNYGRGRYSFGEDLGAFAIIADSSVAISGIAVKTGAFAVNSESSVAIDSIKIVTASVVIDSTSAITVSGGVDAVGSIDMVAGSVLDIQYNRKLSFGMVIADASTIVINGTRAWETQSDISETWTPVEDISESWTTVNDVSESWTTVFV